MHLLLASAMAGTLTLTDTAWFAEDDLFLERRGHRVELPSGFLFGVEADGEPVGVVFVGSGRTHTELSLDEAERIGNHLVLAGDASVERMREVVDHGRITEDVDTVLLLGLDAAVVTHGLREVAVDGGVVGSYDAEGVFQVVVTGHRLGASRRRAKERLHDRQEALALHGLDPHDAIRMDRLEDRDRWVIDAHGETPFDGVVRDAVGSPSSRWTTWIEDPTGAVEEGHHAVWLAHVLVPEDAHEPADVGLRPALGRLAGVEGEPVGSRLQRLRSNVATQPHHSGLYTDVNVESMAIYTSSDDARLVHLRVPCHELEPRYEQVAVGRSCGLDQVTVDDRPIQYIGRGFGRLNHLDEGGVYLLPEPIGADETMVVKVGHHDRLAMGDTVLGPEETKRRFRIMLASMRGDETTMVGGLPEVLQLGASTEAADVLPYAQRPADPVDVLLRAGVPEGRYQVAVSGETDHVLERGPDTWMVVDQPGRPHVVIGDFDGEQAFGGQKGMPAVRILARDPYLDAKLQVHARASIHFFLDALPPFPYDELEIVQGTSELAWEYGDDSLPRARIEAAPGQLVLHGIHAAGDAGRILRSRWPNNLELEIAEGVAAQWWRPIERPYAADDAWIGRVMPRLYTELFLDEAYGKKVVRMWRDVPRDGDGDDMLAEKEVRRVAGLFYGLVRVRAGEEQMLRGLHRFLDEEGRTTAELQHALEEVTGEDFSDLFDVWLRADVAPELTAAWSLKGDALDVQLFTDLPFGRISVPVVVESGRSEVTHWIEVSDGVGHVTLPLEGALGSVAIDPDGLLPLSRIRLDEEGAGRAFAMGGDRVSK